MSETQPSANAESGGAALPTSSRAHRRPAERGLLLLLLVLLLAASWRTVVNVPGLDYYQFWSVGRAVVFEGERDVYSPAARMELGKRFYERTRAEPRSARERMVARDRVQLETYSTPFYYVLFGALSTGDYERDFFAFQALSIALALAAAVWLCRLLGYGWAATGLAVAMLSTPFDPFQAELTVGNANRLQLALFVAFVVLAARASGARGWLAAGLVLGLWVALKPNTLFAAGLVGVSLLAARRFEAFLWQAIGGLLGLASAVAISSAVFGSFQCWIDWAAALQHLLGGFDAPLQAGNFSLIRLLQETAGLDAALPLTLLVGIAVTAVAAVGVRRHPVEAGDRAGRVSQDTWLLGLGCTAPLLFAQVGWLHYYLLVLPLFWRMMAPGAASGATRAVALAAALSISMALFHASGSREAVLAAASVVIGAAALLGIGLYEPWARPGAEDSRRLSSGPETETTT